LLHWAPGRSWCRFWRLQQGSVQAPLPHHSHMPAAPPPPPPPPPAASAGGALRATDGHCGCVPAAALAARWERARHVIHRSHIDAVILSELRRSSSGVPPGGESARHLHPSALLRASHIGC